MDFHVQVGSPSEHVKEFERLFKNVWLRVEEARLKYRPRYGYISLAQAEAIMHRYLDRAAIPADVDRIGVHTSYTHQLLLLAAWRMTKGIYRFDPAIYDEVLDTPLDEDLPCSIFHSLPEWCVYVETPDFEHEGAPRPGYFFGVIEAHEGAPAALAWYGPGTAALPCPVYQTSIVGLRQRFFRDKPALEPAIHRALSLTLYLCAQNADLGDGTQRPENPAPTKTKNGLRTFPRDQVRKWDVGSRIAAELRASSAQPEVTEAPEAADDAEARRARPRPHTRRSHSHRYWIKNENGERELISKWIGHINVNAKIADDLVESVRILPEEGAAPANQKLRVH
jgi:hypothetical protein